MFPRRAQADQHADLVLRIPALRLLRCRWRTSPPSARAGRSRRRPQCVARPGERGVPTGPRRRSRRSCSRARSRLGLGLLRIARLVRELVLGEERDLAALYAEDVLLEVDARLVRLEHVEAEEEVDRAPFHDRERAREVEVRELELRAVHAPEDARSADALRDAREAAVEEAPDAVGEEGGRVLYDAEWGEDNVALTRMLRQFLGSLEGEEEEVSVLVAGYENETH